MHLLYTCTIADPSSHIANIQIAGKWPKNTNRLQFFLPSWCPGSYLMREYPRHVRCFKAMANSGAHLIFQQIKKGVWCVEKKLALGNDSNANLGGFSINYDVYCHELTVRTSHIDNSHAFLHGPSLFMGLLEQTIKDPHLKINFPPLWSKISTGLKDIADDRSEFLYTAADYTELIDGPLEIGCQQTDGFMCGEKPHELAFYGKIYPHAEDLKTDIHKIVEHISQTMGGMPYDKYTFITHFAPGFYGGLEHGNSTVLQFSHDKFLKRKNYLQWLELVAHEYFHTWNVKRIRPKELGPFDYTAEAMTSMHWLTEGLTSFMDQLFVYRCGLMSIEEYLSMQVENFNRYYQNPGRKFHSLEDSSFNAWIKLYRPDENSRNSSISYYLKGGIVFFILNTLMAETGAGINQLLKKLWQRYESQPEVGLLKSEVLAMIAEIAGSDTRHKFELMIETTEELDISLCLQQMGLEVVYEDNRHVPYLGMVTSFQGDRVMLKEIVLDGPAFKSGLNAGDELLAINGMRILKAQFLKINEFLQIEKQYDFSICRNGIIENILVTVNKKPALIKELCIKDSKKLTKYLGK